MIVYLYHVSELPPENDFSSRFCRFRCIGSCCCLNVTGKKMQPGIQFDAVLFQWLSTLWTMGRHKFHQLNSTAIFTTIPLKFNRWQPKICIVPGFSSTTIITKKGWFPHMDGVVCCHWDLRYFEHNSLSRKKVSKPSDLKSSELLSSQT